MTSNQKIWEIKSPEKSKDSNQNQEEEKEIEISFETETEINNQGFSSGIDLLRRKFLQSPINHLKKQV